MTVLGKTKYETKVLSGKDYTVILRALSDIGFTNTYDALDFELVSPSMRFEEPSSEIAGHIDKDWLLRCATRGRSDLLAGIQP